MAKENGGDVAAVYQAVQSLAGEMRKGFADVRQEMRTGLGEVRQEIGEVRQEMRSGLADVRQEVAGLRQTVTEYHSAVLGHGILITELEARVRRLERHVGLPPEV